MENEQHLRLYQLCLSNQEKMLIFFISPPEKKNERININNVGISDEDFYEAFSWVKAKVGTASMSHFE